ncbi:MAG: hypothetical protein AB1391_01345 [Candidatus Micrarchaeota archaeon]
MKGQGSTEYLVILAVVLVVALIVIGLLGQFTGFGASGLEQQSNAYWQGAMPFSITDKRLNSTQIRIVLVNKLATKLNVTNITFDGTGINSTLAGNATIPQNQIASGQAVTIVGDVVSANPCATVPSGTIYQVNQVVITYTSYANDNIVTGLTQAGDKGLYGKCS